MQSLKKSILILIITLITLSGCTQVVTAPIDIAASVVGATITVAGATIDAVSDDEEAKED